MQENYKQAARRHYADAEHLARDERWENACHLLGFAAECGLKHAVANLRPGQSAPHLHLPELAQTAVKLLHGRDPAHRSLRTLLNDPDFFKDWAVRQRYHPDGSVTAEHYKRWLTHARRTLGAAKLKEGPS
ncbi:MAG: hypothetical protein IPK80_03555 [Nannocystis sp.]|nr:hypothetical protein [Nannocystis sp.]